MSDPRTNGFEQTAAAAAAAGERRPSMLASMGWVAASTWIALPLNFITTVVVVRLLGAEGRGIVVLLETTVALLSALLHFGIPTAAVYYVRQARINARRAMSTYAVYGVVVWVVVALLAWAYTPRYVELFFGDARLSAATLALATLYVPFHLVDFFQGTLLVAQRQSRLYAAGVVARPVIYLALSLLLVAGLGWGVAGIILARLISLVAVMAAMSLRSGWSAPAGRSLLTGEELRTLGRYGVQHYVGTVGAQLVRRADNFFLGYYLTVAAVGYYSVALTFYSLLMTIPQAIATVLVGEISDRGQRAPLRVGLRMAQFAMLAALLASVPLAIVAPVFVPVLFGPDFAQAVPPLWILLVAIVFTTGANTISAVFVGMGRPLTGSIGTVIGGVVNIGLNWILIPRYQLIGCALATLGASVAMLAYQLIVIRTWGVVEPGDGSMLGMRDLRQAARSIRRRLGALARRDRFATNAGGA